ncbi:MAG: DEAD/DEAH box helicase [Erysipelotrichales bacterium]|nr:DEAD/DEAH box helicase [Erysipelotrichales bacterium]
MNKFNEFGLNQEILDTLSKINFDIPTKIQQKVIPLALKGEDVIGKSETGSGKTHAFLLPLLQKIDVNKNEVQAVILTPTRELASQIMQMVMPFITESPKIKGVLMSSGLDRERMFKKIEDIPHIIIGTPGRIKDIAFTKASLNITNCNTLVLDEADMILESGFIDDVSYIIGKMKAKLQMLVFSATFNEQLLQFLRKYMNSPCMVDLNKENISPTKITHICYPTRNKDKTGVLIEVLNTINPYMCLIFASRKETVKILYDKLKQSGFNVGIIHGDLDSTTRRVMMKRIRNNEFNIIVSSDIAARGIDIDGVSHVINFDLPYEKEFYFHRAGRTGRANYDGVCITLYDKEEIKKLEEFHNMGVDFKNMEFRNGLFFELKPLFKERKAKNFNKHPEYKKIIEVVNKSKKNGIRPGYKKKMKEEIDKIKRKYRRHMIEEDIKRQIKERAIKKNLSSKEEGEND